MADWSSTDYLKFANERSRPARDLLAQVPLSAPKLIYDLGCGPGNSTMLLDEAFPDAEITGVDNSPAMLTEARRILPKRTFIQADLNSWMPTSAANLLFSNATFQWIPHHAEVLVHMLKVLRSGSVVALQMPDNMNEPSHALMRETAADGPWTDKLRGASTARSSLMEPRGYYDLLKPRCATVDIWHTVYNHALDGAQGIVDLVSSTGLRPFLAPLDEDERVAFLHAYQMRLGEVYQPMFNGKVFLRFPRLFIVATV